MLHHGPYFIDKQRANALTKAIMWHVGQSNNPEEYITLLFISLYRLHAAAPFQISDIIDLIQNSY